MPLISKSLPNLLGGVSQQPDAVRYDNQCEVMVNAFPSVLDGLVKRPPSEHVRQMKDYAFNDEVGISSDSEDYFTHFLPLDSDNQFAMLVDSGLDTPAITVQNIDGTPSDSVLVPQGTDYLKMSDGFDAYKDLRAITIADYTFLVNRSKTVAMSGSLSSLRNTEALLYLKNGDYSTKYTVELDTKKSRPSTRVLDGSDDYFSVADDPGILTGYIDF